jgi:preprotein translocase subunit YajC
VPASLLSNELLLAQNVPPKATTPGVAQDSTPSLGGGGGGGGGSSSSPLSGFLPIVMMLVVFVPFFLLMSRKQKKEQAARSSLKKGDRVMTTSGLVGELMEIDERLSKVKIAPGVTVQILANGVALRRGRGHGEGRSGAGFEGLERSQSRLRKEMTAGRPTGGVPPLELECPARTFSRS